ncbi:MAG TPA: acyl-CoA dehydrogenase family protein [Gaiellaceae bacterium]|jgi:acyl-CoA dehydrogenase|nr:acyl-CoA dehydrogenase family protein [Gaiellaceae bacterium]
MNLTIAPSPSLDLLAPPEQARDPLARIAWRISSEVAAEVADDVDRAARFPVEAVTALREERLLSALLPEELGGFGAGIGAVAAAVRALALNCSAAALVLAMHSVEVVALERFGTTPALRGFLSDLADDQLLIANANSEVGIGSEPGRSKCALVHADGRWTLDKEALAISYGEYADAIVATARRAPESPETDQVLVLARRDDIELTPLSSWDTIGLRGTCSNGFRLQASGPEDAIFPVPFPRIAAGGLLHVGQILLSSVWLGLAERAVRHVHEHARREARRTIGVVPQSAFRLAELAVELQAARSMVACAIQTYEALADSEHLEDPGQLIAARSLKVATSQTAASLASQALGICGISTFRRDSPQSLDRLLRDSHGGLVMVNNHSNLRLNAQALTARKSV